MASPRAMLRHGGALGWFNKNTGLEPFCLLEKKEKEKPGTERTIVNRSKVLFIYKYTVMRILNFLYILISISIYRYVQSGVLGVDEWGVGQRLKIVVGRWLSRLTKVTGCLPLACFFSCTPPEPHLPTPLQTTEFGKLGALYFFLIFGGVGRSRGAIQIQNSLQQELRVGTGNLP